MANVAAPPLSSALARFALFQLFPAEPLQALAAGGDSLNVPLGERVFRRGEVGRYLYVILRGRVRFSRKQPAGGRVTLATCGAGELLGDEALAAPSTYAATCRAAEHTLLHRLPLDRVLDLICQHPEVDFWLPGLLRLHRLTKRLRDEEFAGLRGPEEFASLLDVLRPVQFAPGSRIAAAGAPGEGWFYLRAGTVAGARGAAPGAELGPGDSFGTEALLGLGSPVDLVALTAVDCFCLSRREFERLHLVVEAPSVQSVAASVGTVFSWVGQQGAADCGAAALAMAARRLGRRVAIEDVHELLVLGERGVHMESLARAAAALGLSVHAVAVGPEALTTVALPAIALLTAEHFVVVYEAGSATVLVGDPTRGVVALGRDEFLRQWSGNLLLLSAERATNSARTTAATAAVGRLRTWIEQTKTGDTGAWDSLLRHFGQQMERTARTMVQHFEDLISAEDQWAWLEAARPRLNEQLQQSRPDNLRQAVRLAAEQARRELADMVRLCQAADANRRASGKRADDLTEQLDRWQAFHEASARLPDEERELIGLYFYLGWTVSWTAELLEVDEATVRRRRQTVGVTMAALLNHQFPKF